MHSFTTSVHGERYLHEVNRDAFASRPSPDAFERRFDAELDGADTLHVVVGTDSGLLARWVAGRDLGEGSRVLFVELDEYRDDVLEALGGPGDGVAPGTAPDTAPELSPDVVSIVAPGVSLCAARDVEAAVAGHDPGRYLYAGRVLVLESLGCAAGYAPGYGILARRVRGFVGELVHAAGLRVGTRSFVDAQLRNVADNRRPAAGIGRVGDGATAVVLGGGPSLDDHLDWVLEHRDRLFVIAVSRIAERLASAGLVPDVVVAVDPQDILFDVSKAWLARADVPLVSSYHVCPILLQQWRGPTLYTGRALPWESTAIDDADNLEALGSTVSHVALWLAHRWGFAQILLSGVDLCYAPGGATHASGSLESLCETLPAHYDAQVTTYAGRRAGTAMPLKLGRDELERMGAAIAAAGGSLVNLAPDAARVDSIAHRCTADVELGGPRPVLELAPDAADAGVHLDAVRRELLAARRAFAGIRRLCTEANRRLDGLHGRRGRVPDYRHKKKLDALQRSLDKRHARWMRLIGRYGAHDFARIVGPRGFETMTDDELERWGRDYYRVVDDNAARLLERVRDALERVRHRRLEADDAAGSVEALVDYWRTDRTLGRVALALEPPPAGLDDGAREAIAAARREHGAELARTDTGYREAHAKHQLDPARLLATIALLVEEDDAEDLGRVRDGLVSMGEPWAPFAEWAAGRCAELESDADGALEHYRRLIERHASLREAGEAVPVGAERLLEDVLIRTVHLQLAGGDGESALEGLSILTALSPGYVPKRAALLALLGRRDEAAGLLQELIGSGAGDWRAALQLADLYRDAGAAEAAAVAVRVADRLRSAAGAVGARTANAAEAA